MRLWVFVAWVACTPVSEQADERDAVATRGEPASGAETTSATTSAATEDDAVVGGEESVPAVQASAVETSEPTPDLCPTDVEGPAGACREEGRRCPLADGDCVCARHPVVQGVALAPGEEPPTNPRRWDCRPSVREDGCPGRPPSGRCRREGQRCGYLAHEPQAVCAQGTWMALPPDPVP